MEIDNFLELKKEIKRRGLDFVILNGMKGAGKTTLADKIGEELGFFVIHGDDFQYEDNDEEPLDFSIHNFFNIQKINNQIDDMREDTVVLECIYSFKMINLLNINSGKILKVYLKKMKDYGKTNCWLDNPKQKKITNMNGCELEQFNNHVVSYYRKNTPYEDADIEYLRFEEK